MASLGVLSVDLIARTGGFNKNLKQAEKQSQTFGRRVKRHFASIEKSIKRLGLVAVGLGTAFAALTPKVLDQVTAQGDLSDQLGISVERLTQLQYAAHMTGSSSENLSKGLAVLQKRLGQVALTGGGTAKKAIDGLGLSIDKLMNMSLEDKLIAIRHAMADVSDEATRNAIAANLFSRRSQDLVGMLSLTDDQIKDLIQTSDNLGNTITGSMVQKAGAAQDAMDNLHAAINGITRKMVTSFSPAITAVANGFTTQLADSMDQTQDQVVDWSQVFGNILVTTLDVGRDAVFALSKAFEVLGSAIGAVAAALDRVIHGKFQQAGEVFKAFGDDVEKINDEILSFNTRKFRDELDKARASAKQFEQSGSQSVYLGIGDSGQGTGNVARGSTSTAAAIGPSKKSLEKSKSYVDSFKRDMIGDQQAIVDNYEDQQRRRNQIAEQWTGRVFETFNQNLFSPMKNGFGDVLDSFIKMIGQMSLKYLESGLVDKLFGTDTQKNTGFAQLGTLFQGQGGKQKQQKSVMDSFVHDFDNTLTGFDKDFGGTLGNFGSSFGNLLGGFGNSLSGMFSSLFGGSGGGSGWFGTALSAFSSFAGFFADGGSIPRGKFGVAGESGPELVTGPANVVPANKLGGGQTIVNVNNAPEGTTVRRRKEGQQEIIDVMIDDVSNGGRFYKALSGMTNVGRAGR